MSVNPYVSPQTMHESQWHSPLNNRRALTAVLFFITCDCVELLAIDLVVTNPQIYKLGSHISVIIGFLVTNVAVVYYFLRACYGEDVT
jgi:hypothetical protein